VTSPISQRQRDFARAVAVLTKRRGFPPTLAELAIELAVSLPRAAQLADACQARGAVTREPRVARSLRVVVQPTKGKSKRASGGNR
jgi:SOS-response transcriptional repressor LexA